MKCPECGEILRAKIPENQDEDSNFVEVEFYCFNEKCQQVYFTRVKEDDLILA